MSYQESIVFGMSSHQISNEKHVSPIKEVRRSKSYNCLYVPSNVKELEDEQHSPKKQNNVMKRREHHLIEHQSSQSNLLDESSIFMIKTIVLLILIVLPGNIFAVSIFYKHLQKDHNTVEPPTETLNHSFNMKSATIHSNLGATGLKTTEKKVSENHYIYFFINTTG